MKTAAGRFCSAPATGVSTIPIVDAPRWRPYVWSTYDILDSWESPKTGHAATGQECYSGRSHDVDMLVVGMYNKGNVALGGCTDEEYKTHFIMVHDELAVDDRL